MSNSMSMSIYSPSNSSSKKNSNNIDIKGGGIASLSKHTEHEIVSLLYDLRDERNPLKSKQRPQKLQSNGNGNGEQVEENLSSPSPTPTPSSSDNDNDGKKKKNDNRGGQMLFRELSQHEQKREKKRFLKRLLDCHHQQSTLQQFHSKKKETGTNNNNNNNNKHHHHPRTPSTLTPSATSGRSDLKVRVDIVEAVYKKEKKGDTATANTKKDDDKKLKKNKKKSSSSSKKKRSSSSTPLWKPGSIRKTIVVTIQNTSISDLLKLCKSKLNMKKKPIRLFTVQDTLELDLKHDDDLIKLHDGSVVYATSTLLETITTTTTTATKQDGGNHDDETDEIVPMIEKEDVLESVKRAYRLRAQTKKSSSQKYKSHSSTTTTPTKAQQQQQQKPSTSSSQQEPYKFTPYLDKLPPLSIQRQQLPAASYRSNILSALDTSRILIICGQTGCGKSTQIPQYILEGFTSIGGGVGGGGGGGAVAGKKILVTQPRRVAATTLAMRVAKERNTPSPGMKGSDVGYHVRLNNATTPDTKIIYCTVGILLKMLISPQEEEEEEEEEAVELSDGEHGSEQKEPPIPLSNVSHVVIDEVHERDLNTDFVLTLLRPLLNRNKHLSVILMSATASADLFVNYFRNYNGGGLEPKVFEIPGRTFPVQTQFLSDCEKITSSRLNGWVDDVSANNNNGDGSRGGGASTEDNHYELSPTRATSKIDYEFITKLIGKISQQQQQEKNIIINEHKMQSNGAILIFLPGKGEIDELTRTLQRQNSSNISSKCKIVPLHSTLSPGEQRQAFELVPMGTLKIVLATNVAETSITIPDISIVIDTGRVKESRFNPSSQIKELVTVWTSRASAKQRAGRAGRTGPGVCYKLYKEEFENGVMPLETSPEIVRTPLDELILQVCLLEEQEQTIGDASSFGGTSPIQFLSEAPEPPPTKSLLYACKHLVDIGALTLMSKTPNLMFRLTPLGFHLSHLPMDPKVGKILIVGSMLQCMESALTIAATLSCSKSCWLPFIPGENDSKQKAREIHEDIVRNGFGGEGWKGGTVKGDIIGVVAAYNEWSSSSKYDKERRNFAKRHALDHNAMLEMKGLRSQFKRSMIDAGLWDESFVLTSNDDDALLASCCLVAGLYPNITTLIRPSREKRIRSGKLVVKGGDSFEPSSRSFQKNRVRNASEGGKDAYAVFLSKHRNVGVTRCNAPGSRESKMPFSFLSEINFVSRFSLLIFGGGQFEIRDNCMIVDEWLKFRVKVKVEEKDSQKKAGHKSTANAVLIQELRKELDNVLLKHIMCDGNALNDECRRVVDVIRCVLLEE